MFFTWIPPHNSLLSPNSIIRTLSPYFSPNNAIAPCAIATWIGMLLCSFNFNCSSILWFTKSSTWRISSSVTLAKCEKSKRRWFGFTNEPFCSTCVPKIVLNPKCIKCVAEWFLEVDVSKSVLTFATKLASIFSGSCFAKWRIRLFSFLVSMISIVSLAETKVPLSPTCPPPSG